MNKFKNLKATLFLRFKFSIIKILFRKLQSSWCIKSKFIRQVLFSKITRLKLMCIISMHLKLTFTLARRGWDYTGSIFCFRGFCLFFEKPSMLSISLLVKWNKVQLFIIRLLTAKARSRKLHSNFSYHLFNEIFMNHRTLSKLKINLLQT